MSLRIRKWRWLINYMINKKHTLNHWCCLLFLTKLPWVYPSYLTCYLKNLNEEGSLSIWVNKQSIYSLFYSKRVTTTDTQQISADGKTSTMTVYKLYSSRGCLIFHYLRQGNLKGNKGSPFKFETIRTHQDRTFGRCLET